MNSSYRWWVNWRDPIFNEDRAIVDDFETGKELRRTESEPDLTFNYSKLTGEIDGDDEIVPNGNVNIAQKRSREANKTRTSATTKATTASAALKGSRGGAKSSTGARTQTAISTAGSSRDIRRSHTFDALHCPPSCILRVPQLLCNFPAAYATSLLPSA